MTGDESYIHKLMVFASVKKAGYPRYDRGITSPRWQ